MSAELIREGRHTRVYVIGEPGPGGARRTYVIEGASCPEGCTVTGVLGFQDGPIQEAGVNGLHNEDLLAIVIDRLRGFQRGPFACRENELALTKCEQALMFLDARTADRVARGVEGQNKA
jgi:hypothetical protein